MVETERMAHLVADLRAAEAGDRDHLRIGAAARHMIQIVGVVVEKNPARLVGVRNKFHVGGQFPFAQAGEVGVGLRGGQRVGEFIRHDAVGPGHRRRACSWCKNFPPPANRRPATTPAKQKKPRPPLAGGGTNLVYLEANHHLMTHKPIGCFPQACLMSMETSRRQLTRA